MSSASGSFAAPPARPMGLIVVVLLLDLGLAAIGGVLLAKGLSKEDKKPDVKSETPPVEKKAALEAPAPAPAAVATVAAAAAKQPEVAASGAIESKVAAAREAPKDSKRGEKAKALVEDKAKGGGAKPADKPVTSPASVPAPTKPEEPKRVDGVPTQPVDPAPTAKTDTNQEIESASAASKPAFARCVAQAGEVHGAIKVALQVRSDGHVVNAAAVENTTGDAELGRCLVSEVSTWRVSAHDGAAINLLRTFNYP